MTAYRQGPIAYNFATTPQSLLHGNDNESYNAVQSFAAAFSCISCFYSLPQSASLRHITFYTQFYDLFSITGTEPYLRSVSQPVHYSHYLCFFMSSPELMSSCSSFSSIRIPPVFHDYLRTCSASNTLLLALFTTSACAPCRTITPILTSLVRDRLSSPADKFSSIAFTEAELDSSDDSNGRMTDLAVEYAITSMPTLVGFGGRRAERITERIVDTRMLADRERMQQWLDEVMQKGDLSGTGTNGGGLFGRLFG